MTGTNYLLCPTLSPHKSSLLQTFVSIQGLVLVREPYFCEPAFDKLRGTKEALVNSRQYKCVQPSALALSLSDDPDFSSRIAARRPSSSPAHSFSMCLRTPSAGLTTR